MRDRCEKRLEAAAKDLGVYASMYIQDVAALLKAGETIAKFAKTAPGRLPFAVSDAVSIFEKK